jgi:hypothetical protein
MQWTPGSFAERCRIFLLEKAYNRRLSNFTYELHESLNEWDYICVYIRSRPNGL